MKHTKIAVIGGTGKSGKYVVKHLIEKGLSIKVLVRDPKNFNNTNPLVEVIHGNIYNYGTVMELLKGCDAIVSTLGMGIPYSEPSIFSKATRHIIEAMTELKIHRYVVVTGLNVDTVFDKKGPKTKFGTDWMYQNYPKSTADRQKEYELLLKSSVDWTLVRLPLILQTDDRKEIGTNLQDCSGDNISATDLAHFLIDQLVDKTFLQKAPFLFNK